MPKKPPAYRCHRQSGKAIVTLPDGAGGRHDVLLGVYDSPASWDEYHRVVALWKAGGRPWEKSAPAPAELTVNELLVKYWEWATGYYRDDEGKPARELDNLKDALRPLRKVFGHTLTSNFGPVALRTLQTQLVKDGLVP